MTGILIKAHFINRYILEKVACIADALSPADNVRIILSIDVTHGLSPSVNEIKNILHNVELHFFDAQTYRKHGLSEHPAYAATRSPVNWFHSDYSLIDFHILNRGRYDILWQIEYDVYLRSGSWKFLSHDYAFDFMAPSIKVKEPQFAPFVQSSCIVQPQWHWWGKLDRHVPTVGCFFPCVRITAAALEHVISSYQAGVSGYCEVSVPSLIAAAGNLRIAALSEVSNSDATIYHPHWSKTLKNDFTKDFHLNAVDLSVD